MNRLADRLLALLLAVVAVACVAHIYLLPGAMDFALNNLPQRLREASVLQLAAFSVLAFACLVGAALFWAGSLPGRVSLPAGAPLFGRAAEAQETGRPRLRQAFLILPAIAVMVLLATSFGPWRAPGQDVASAPPAEPSPKPVAPQPPEQAAKPLQPAPVTPPEPVPTSPVAPTPPQPAVPTPPEVADVPPVAPPTVAPLPKTPVQPTQPDGHRDAVVWLSVAPDGHSILSASTDHMIKLWDIGGKRLIRNLGTHKDMARSALYLPDGQRALTAGDDGEIVLRQLSDGAVLHVFQAGGNGGANKLAITPDGKRAVSVHEAGTVIVWDLEKGTVLHVMQGHDWSAVAVAVSPDGTRAISGSIDGTLKYWDIVAGKQLRSWRGHEQGAYGAVFTPDGHHVITGSGDDTIKEWDLDTFKAVREFDGHSGTVYVLALSGDGKRLLSGSLDGTARLWDMGSGNELAEYDSQSGPVYAVAFAADGTVLTSGYDRTIRDWPATGGEAVVLFAGAPQ
ncbi:WD40 repeat domain-containing protein [Mesorhizobium sp. INR15]|uniref:WD40 repeat domain-containing protein n=1 Tax=Mesorhizobium sp. INR15 TaxID=2654248 RepID=UPI0018965A5D|nr:WD40 repeat domain-containing protein [Mesorhizobium sp. INR15]QPC91912.1 WD40 repeat domain-containing protein [Mesorhizobium sp. INR15]